MRSFQSLPIPGECPPWHAGTQCLWHRSQGECPGPGQDGVSFCYSQERAWLGPGGCSEPPPTIFQGQGRKSPLGKCMAAWAGIARLHGVHGCPIPLPCILHYLYCCCYCSFSWFIAVSSILFLSQPTIFSFCASSSPLKPTREGKGKGEGSEEQWFAVFQWEFHSQTTTVSA